MDSSPFITEIDLQPPSPRAEYDPFTEFTLQHSHTPSYAGSFNNSPFSAHSDLSPSDPSFNLFDDEPPGITIAEYDPAEYDPPDGQTYPSSLLMFNDHITDFSLSARSPPFDYSSPSSNGGGDSGTDADLHRRSRASSNASSNHPTPSPHLQFENLSFTSPSWPPNSLPPTSPPEKPLSPPQLRIPDDGGPQLHIVPATPVGGGVGSSQAPFRASLEKLHQGSILFDFHPHN
jgi:hypothetical protein